MKYAKGDILTDDRNNSVEITEICNERYSGRKIGALNPNAPWEAAGYVIDEMSLDCLPLAERILSARKRLAALESSGRSTEHVTALISRLESLQ